MPEKLLNVSGCEGSKPPDTYSRLQKQCELSNGLNVISQRLLSCLADDISDAIKFAISSSLSLIESELGMIYIRDQDLINGKLEHFWSTSTLQSPQIDSLTLYFEQQLSESVESDFWISTEAELLPADLAADQMLIFPLNFQTTFKGYIAFAVQGEQTDTRSLSIDYLRTLKGLLSSALCRCRDIKRLVVEKERLRVGQIYANIGTWEWDLLTDNIFYSEQMIPLLGLPEGELNMDRQFFVNSVHPDDQDKVKQRVRQVIESDTPYEIEHRVIWRDGTVRWVLEKGAVIRDEKGKPLKLLGTVQDIHEQKLAQIALEERQKELKQTQAMAKLGRWTVDLKTGELEISDEVYDIHGLDPGKDSFTMETGRKAVYPADFEKLTQMDQQLMDTGHCDLTHRIVCPGGEVRHVYVLTWAKKSPEGDFVALDGFIQDVTHRVQLEANLSDSQKRLAFAIEGFGDAIWDWNLLDNSIEYTGLSKNFLGYDDGELPSEIRVLSTLQHPDDREALSLVHNRCLRGETESYQQEMRMRCKDGSYKWLMCRATAVERDEKGAATRMIGIHSDITDRKAREDALTLARDEAERANLAKSEFLSHMSHELRTPMNAILGFGQLLKQDDSLSAENDDHVSEVLNAGNHLLDLINEVLDLSKIEAGKLTLSVEPVQVKSILQEITTLLEPLAADRNVRLEISLVESISVMADKTRLKQVMINLLSNAIKYNRFGGRVLVSAQREGPGRARISVEDTGVGIDECALEAIFDPFNRLGAESSEIEGTGIGLTLTKALVEMMGGAISVDSAPEQGSRFWVDLPLAKRYVINEHSAARSERVPATEQALKSKTVLYIDDNPVNLKLVRHILGTLPNIRVVEAGSGELGISMAQTLLPDMVLVDINMPGIDGYQVLKILRESPEFVDKPIIAVTANAMASDIAKGRAAGFSDYLSKPFDIATFKSMVCGFFEQD